MSDLPPQPPEKPPLEYRNYSDDRPARTRAVRSLVAGVLLGIVGTAFVGFGAAISTLDIHPVAQSHRSNRFIVVIAFGCTAIAAGVFSAFLLRRENRRFMLAGFLLGIAVTCLIEGVCFF